MNHARPTREPSSYQSIPTLHEDATRELTQKSNANLSICRHSAKFSFTFIDNLYVNLGFNKTQPYYVLLLFHHLYQVKAW